MSKNVQRGIDQEIQALKLIGRFKWLRLQELSLFMWPGSPEVNRYQYAQNLIKKMREKNYIFTQTMPDRAGTAVFLREKGAKIARDKGIQCRRANLESPLPRYWRHELLSHGIVAVMSPEDFRTEFELKKSIKEGNYLVDKPLRIPDLIIKSDIGTLGVEVERAQKGGQKRNNMVENAVDTNKTNGGPRYSFDGLNPEKIAFAFNPVERSESGARKINHEKNITRGLEIAAEEKGVTSFDTIFIHLTIKNFGVTSCVLYMNGEYISHYAPGYQSGSLLYDPTL